MSRWGLRLAGLLLVLLLAAGYFVYSSLRAPAGLPAPPVADWHNAAALFAGDAIFRPEIPKTWDDELVASLELPLADPEASPRQVTSEYYYQIPVMPIYKSYPMYLPERAPEGYLDRLRKEEPKLAWDVRDLKTESDWIKAGEIVFRAPILFLPLDEPPPLPIRLLLGLSESYLESLAKWGQQQNIPMPTDGTFPYDRIFIREKGRLEAGTLSCATCHTRVQPDGSLIIGAQGNFPSPVLFPVSHSFFLRGLSNQFFKTPWLDSDPAAAIDEMTSEEIQALAAQAPPGVMARHGTSFWTPVQIPDLIGIKDRKYLDRTGLVQHRDIGDLMRYAALNQVTDILASYKGYVPIADTLPFEDGAPDPSTLLRYSDAQLYALGLFVYSLKAPVNPNPVDKLAERGEEIFRQEHCDRCHVPPLYTSNKLTPASGFSIPSEHRQKFDIFNYRVGTDPRLTLQTRRGTGYYKVPSLKGVWYRGPFEHSGSVLTLEDWFDPARLREDYVPSGFKGIDKEARAVPGHLFGLDLFPEEKRALIAFLRTL